MRKLLLVALVCLGFSSPLWAQTTILFQNANVFNGVDKNINRGVDILIEDGLIKSIGPDLVAPEGAKTIDASGHTMIPGLIDAHWHTSYCCAAQSTVVSGDVLEIAIRGAIGAEATLLRGFTTVRDVGGNPFSTKKMIDAGELVGPRIFPSGPPISQTSGHFDYRSKQSVPTNPGDALEYWNRNAILIVADGVPEVTKRAREILRMGATQLKIAGGGGVSSVYDPLDVQEYTYEEMRAIVEVAETWNTYVAAHIFTDKATQTALKAGIKSIEHGNLLSEETLRLMKKEGAWLSVQPLINDEDAFTFDDPFSTQKWIQVTDGTDRVIKLAKEIGVRMAWGTDMLFDPATAAKQGKFVVKMERWFTPYEVMKMVTSDNAELLQMAGPRNPYPQGQLGVIAEGAHADIILVDGNPLEKLDLIADPEQNFDLIMKGGKIFKENL
ncbi:metal-dependent hydrolase family protein [Ferrimonas balearica]|uniref:metal-dependent hydrolase family protein n=1 Tax=Ferrimonas balearica TaxID=44012 RepID=UPI001C9763B1|nr:amidohydrolase family protein [Ferrimonas balearica]MBY6223790.1 amidohydrolase family protein [Ferrimonas balearica]